MLKATIKRLLYRLTDILLENHRAVAIQLTGKSFRSHGADVVFNRNDFFSYENITIGNSVLIGSGATFIASRSQIIIGNKVLFGPNVTLVGGDHTVSRVGTFIYDITNKTKDPEDDADIIIEDDVWIGANVTILKGVQIGRGCVVGAGSVVTKSLTPYAIAVGIPARPVKGRFTAEEILAHEERLYAENLRFAEDEIRAFMVEYQIPLSSCPTSKPVPDHPSP